MSGSHYYFTFSGDERMYNVHLLIMQCTKYNQCTQERPGQNSIGNDQYNYVYFLYADGRMMIGVAGERRCS